MRPTNKKPTSNIAHGFGFAGELFPDPDFVFNRTQEGRLDHIDLAAVAALAVDQLAALLGPHAGAETDLADALGIRNFVGIMHGSTPREPSQPRRHRFIQRY